MSISSIGVRPSTITGRRLEQEGAGNGGADLFRDRPVRIALVDAEGEALLILPAAEPPLVLDERRVCRLDKASQPNVPTRSAAPRRAAKARPVWRTAGSRSATGGPKPAPVGAAYGRAKTQSTEPPSGMPISGVSVAHDPPALEPLPTATATYCLPSTA